MINVRMYTYVPIVEDGGGASVCVGACLREGVKFVSVHVLTKKKGR